MAIRYRQNAEDGDALIAEINTTPLVDVMLVLLIIFLITIPVVNSSIAVALPREQNQRVDAQQENAIVTVDAEGAIYWFDTRLPDRATLAELLKQIEALKKAGKKSALLLLINAGGEQRFVAVSIP